MAIYVIRLVSFTHEQKKKKIVMLEFRIVYCSFVFNLESESGCLNVFSEAYSVVVYM